ncbi:HAD family hydrolase [bacterium]|nr:HAD family hydrolase [bacterium]
MKKQMSKYNYLALDFDGVIADSIQECLVVGCNAFIEYTGKGNKITNLSSLDLKDMSEFRRLRYFIRSGEDYVYIQLALFEGANIQTQQDFDRFVSKKAHLKQTFFDLIYQERERLLNQFTDIWIQLNPLYDGMREFISQFTHREHFAIISTKKQIFIHRILEGHGINFPMQRILQAVENRPKSQIILDLLKQSGLEPAHFIFVDDHADTLIKMKHTAVTLCLAGWGYNNDAQKTRVRKACLPVLTLDQFYQTMKTCSHNEKSNQT